MSEWGLSVKVFSWGLDIPPQVLNLNQGVAVCEKGTVLSNPTP